MLILPPPRHRRLRLESLNRDTSNSHAYPGNVLLKVQDTGHRLNQANIAEDEVSTAAALDKSAQAQVVSNLGLTRPMLCEYGAHSALELVGGGLYFIAVGKLSYAQGACDWLPGSLMRMDTFLED
ncbi:hypothetical protein IEO21_06720 [Rhodonia placenta]|uniref:Uncharacterized protein n=1 Tax=Rhodonia placenta TaxID=104341 RepID=A0A8H7NZJ2_9APHY|nr:hypothetical protein IEO21_06720 [Postia placenta]